MSSHFWYCLSLFELFVLTVVRIPTPRSCWKIMLNEKTQSLSYWFRLNSSIASIAAFFQLLPESSSLITLQTLSFCSVTFNSRGPDECRGPDEDDPAPRVDGGGRGTKTCCCTVEPEDDDEPRGGFAEITLPACFFARSFLLSSTPPCCSTPPRGVEIKLLETFLRVVKVLTYYSI